MRTDLSEAFLSELARDGGKPAQYLLIKMPDNDRYLSDRPLEYAAGLYCEPLVADWGTLTDALGSSELIYDAVMPQREHRLSVLNTKQAGWFASLFTEELHQNTRVELWQGFEQTEPGQYVPLPVLIDEFVLQTPISLSSGGMTVDITLRQLLAAADPVIGPQDQAGGRYPVAVGGVLVKARLHGPQPVARLVADVVVGAAEISTDRDLAKAGWPASGAADLDFETFTYAGLAGNVFTSVTGIGKLHSSGQWVVKQSYQYVFGVCAAPATVTGVYAGGKQVTSGFSINSDGGLVKIIFDTVPSEIVQSRSTYEVSRTLTEGELIPRSYAFKESHVSGSSMYIDSGTWIVNEIAATNPLFGIDLPLGAAIVSGSVTAKFRLHMIDDPFDSGSSFFYLCGIPYSKSWIDISGDYTDFEQSRPVFSPADLLPGKNKISYRADASSGEYPENTLACVHQELSITAEYSLDDPGFPKKAYYFDEITVRIGEEGGAENPADVIDRLLNIKAMALDAASKNTVAAEYDDLEYSFRGLIAGDLTVNAAVESALRQCRSRIVSNAGKVRLLLQKPLADMLTLRVLSDHDYPPDGLSITEPDVRSGCNSVTLRYAQDSISSDYAAEASAEAAAEQNKYGKLHRDIDAPLVHSQVHAADIAEVIVERDKMPPSILSVSCYLDAFPLEVADKISLFTLWSNLFYFDGELVRTARSFGAPGRVTKIRLDLRGRRVPVQWIELEDVKSFPSDRDALELREDTVSLELPDSREFPTERDAIELLDGDVEVELSDSRDFPDERDGLDELHLGGWGMPWGSPWGI